jgi:hypothetical protein
MNIDLLNSIADQARRAVYFMLTGCACGGQCDVSWQTPCWTKITMNSEDFEFNGETFKFANGVVDRAKKELGL